MSLERESHESIASEAVARWLAAKVAERSRATRVGKTLAWQAALNQEWAVAAKSYAPKQVMFECAHAVDGLMVDLRADPMFQRPMGGRE